MDCFRYIFADIATTDRLIDCLREFTVAINHIDYLRYAISATHKWTTSGMLPLQHTNGLPQVYYLYNIQQTISNILSLQHPDRLSQVRYLCNTQMDYLRYVISATRKWTTSDISATHRLPQVCHLCNTWIDYLRYATSATHKWTTSGKSPQSEILQV